MDKDTDKKSLLYCICSAHSSRTYMHKDTDNICMSVLGGVGGRGRLSFTATLNRTNSMDLDGVVSRIFIVI
jgi:hypothetical protein